MTSYRVQIVLRTADNNPTNYITNTWHCAAITDSDASDFATAVITLHKALNFQYSGQLAQNNHEYKIYDLTDPVPRAPIYEGLWSFASAPAGDGLPPELCVCLSYQAPKISGVPQSRRRGRIYLGPFDSSLNVSGRPTSALITAIANAGEALLNAGIATAGDWNWAVYSTVLGGTADVTNGWVDDEWDIQRRRGRLASTRTVFP